MGLITFGTARIAEVLRLLPSIADDLHIVAAIFGEQTSARECYRRELSLFVLPSHVRMAAAVTLGINFVFTALDLYAFPQQFAGMFSFRLALSVVLIGVLFWGHRRLPEWSQWAVALATGAMLLTVVFGTGAPATTDYYVGLLLYFVGLPVLLPLTGLQNALVSGTLLGVFATAPAIVEGESVSKAFVIHVIFLASGGVVGVGSAVLLDRMRFREFVRRKEAESARDQLAQLDEAKSRFTANVHHELRTPLTLMLAPLDAMLAGDFGEVGETQRSYLATMHKNALRLLKLINNLLDFAKIESGQLELHRQPLELSRLVDDIVASARPMAERKGVELVVDCAAELPLVNADPDALEKIVVNLVGNALKFTDSGGRITVRVACERELDPAESAAGASEPGVLLSVIDTGIGIPPEQIGRVFDRFAQVDGSATRRHEGTGIGLSLVQELTQMHGGRVWATSEGLGHGSQFHVLLPVGTADSDAEEVVEDETGRRLSLRRSFEALGADLDHHGTEADAGSGEAAAGGDDVHAVAARYRTLEMERTVERHEGDRAFEESRATDADPDRPEIVVAEDNADMRRLLVHLLGSEFRVRPARNGREALQLVRGRAPMLVVTDVMMPEMSGTELCAAIKGDATLAGVPVMLVTSKAERDMKIQGLELGADDYVTKPFHPRELVARARSLVRLRELQLELAEQNAALERALEHLRQTEVALVQSERLAAVGELAAGIAHEVNNPVNFALNSLRMLKDTVRQVNEFAARVAALDWCDAAKLAESARELERLESEIELSEVASTLDELVGIVIEGLDRTGRLVRDLRDFGGPGERERVIVDLRSIVESTLGLLGPLFTERRVRVERNFAPDLPAVSADASALKQLVLNLLKNAADALEKSGGTVRISAAASSDGRDAVLSVEDDGPGIAADVRARIFDPFVTTKAAGRGTGLGLSICRRIAEAHRGALEAGEAAMGGAMFTLRLPAETRDGAADRT